MAAALALGAEIVLFLSDVAERAGDITGPVSRREADLVLAQRRASGARPAAWGFVRSSPVGIWPVGWRYDGRHLSRHLRPYRIVSANELERAMRRAARAHAIFCMNLEEAGKSAFREDGREMLGLKARAGEPRHRIRWKAESGRL